MKTPIQSQQTKALEPPDVALGSRPEVASKLEWAGMEKVASPIKMRLPDGQEILTPAELDLGVSLDQAEARGIHMSRLFTLAQQRLGQMPLNLLNARSLAAEMITSQSGLSENAFLNVRFTLPLLRQALVSEQQGWRQYPVWLKVQGNPKSWTCQMGVEVLYSSTCPCSAALSRQVLLDQFSEAFTGRASLSPTEVKDWLEEHGLPATPHAQRSRAVVEVDLAQAEFAPHPWELIDLIEARLGTAVQAAVKRVDEQAFALLNAENFMFCEDAARLLKAAMNEDQRLRDFNIMVEHQESLHAHNAVARTRK
ncbi:MAG: GTP cyclohydrolase FolE2 [Bdellovibrionales bacterium]